MLDASKTWGGGSKMKVPWRGRQIRGSLSVRRSEEEEHEEEGERMWGKAAAVGF